jgi:hypothetical protein
MHSTIYSKAKMLYFFLVAQAPIGFGAFVFDLGLPCKVGGAGKSPRPENSNGRTIFFGEGDMLCSLQSEDGDGGTALDEELDVVCAGRACGSRA